MTSLVAALPVVKNPREWRGSPLYVEKERYLDLIKWLDERISPTFFKKYIEEIYVHFIKYDI